MLHRADGAGEELVPARACVDGARRVAGVDVRLARGRQDRSARGERRFHGVHLRGQRDQGAQRDRRGRDGGNAECQAGGLGLVTVHDASCGCKVAARGG
jgi:hypothetical protein